MPENAKVQILLAVYNGESYLKEQLDSIINQSYKEWELLASDDCSTDASLDILNEYALKDPRIKVISSNKKYGSAKTNFMNLFQNANAKFVMTCDQDDVWDANKIEVTLRCMNKQDQNIPILVCTDLRVVDEDLHTLDNSFLAYSHMDTSKLTFGYFLSSSIVTGCTMMINQRLLEMMQTEINPNKILMHDWWASLIASAFGAIIYLHQPTISYRQHQNNSVGAEKFSIARAIASLDAKKAVHQKTYQQATEFLKVFKEDLSTEQLEQIKSYIAIPSSSKLTRIGLITKSESWRKGALRNLGLLATVMLQ